jgi:ATP-binding cassette, subfamily B, bacterial HlyB/CyaB
MTSHAVQEAPLEDVARLIGGRALLLARRIGGAGADPRLFGFRSFLPTIWRYRRPLGHVLAASLFVPIFGLTTPLCVQVVVDKVLTHRGYETLFVLVGGLVVIGVFDVALQYLRIYALSHTTNRIDVELGQRLFAHLLGLPISYFAADLRHGGDGRAQDRRAAHAGIFVRAAGRGRFESNAGAVRQARVCAAAITIILSSDAQGIALPP